MKNKFYLSLCACLLLGSCATVQKNIDARALLANCKYEFAGISVTGVAFARGIEIDSVDFDVNIKITNTADRDVAVDHVELAFFLDGNHILDLDHKWFARIAPSASSVEPVSTRLPFAEIGKTLGHKPETIGVKAKIWVTLLVGEDVWETPVMIPIELETAVPYDQIDAFIAQKKKQLEDEAKAKIETEAQKLIPPIPSPRF